MKRSGYIAIIGKTNVGKSTILNSLSGKSFSKTICCNENGYYMIIDSDRYGFNNPDYEWTKKPKIF